MNAFAAVATAPWKVEYKPVRVPEPGPDDVVIRVLHSWISNGTEGSFIRGERIAGDTPRSDRDPLPFPHISGYQKTGIVQWIGDNVQDVNIGDLVFATVSRVEDMFFDFAGHISPAVTHQSQVWKLPDGVDAVAASGLVLTQVGYNTGMRPTVNEGDCAIVIGDGMVGHWTAQTLQARGAKILMIGRHDERLQLLALRTGDRLIHEKKEDIFQAVRQWAPQGVQAVCDTVGAISLIEDLIPLMRRDGHISSAGFYGESGHIDIQKMRDRELTLHAPAGWNQARMDATLAMLTNGELKTRHLITHRFPAAQAGEAFDLILSRRKPVLGVVLDWEP